MSGTIATAWASHSIAGGMHFSGMPARQSSTSMAAATVAVSLLGGACALAMGSHRNSDKVERESRRVDIMAIHPFEAQPVIGGAEGNGEMRREMGSRSGQAIPEAARQSIVRCKEGLSNCRSRGPRLATRVWGVTLRLAGTLLSGEVAEVIEDQQHGHDLV